MKTTVTSLNNTGQQIKQENGAIPLETFNRPQEKWDKYIFLGRLFHFLVIVMDSLAHCLVIQGVLRTYRPRPKKCKPKKAMNTDIISCLNC